MQCETVTASLESSHQVSVKVGDMDTPAGKLGSAISQENDKFIGSEGDRQQLLIRCAASLPSHDGRQNTVRGSIAYGTSAS